MGGQLFEVVLQHAKLPSPALIKFLDPGGTGTHLRAGDDWVGSQLFEVVLQRGAALLHKLLLRALPLHRVLLRPRRYEVAAVRHLQQVRQRLNGTGAALSASDLCIFLDVIKAILLHMLTSLLNSSVVKSLRGCVHEAPKHAAPLMHVLIAGESLVPDMN